MQAQYPTASSLRVGGRAEGGSAPRAAPVAAAIVVMHRPTPANLSSSRANASGERTRTLTRRRVGAHARTRAIACARQRGEACARLARASNPKPAAARRPAGLVVSSSARRAANTTVRASENWTGANAPRRAESERERGESSGSGGVAGVDWSAGGEGGLEAGCSGAAAKLSSTPAADEADASLACAAAASPSTDPSTSPSAAALRARGVSRSGGGAGKRGIAAAHGRATLLLSVRPTEKATQPPEVDSAAASARPGSGPGSSSLRITSVGPGQSDVWFTTRCAGKREDGDGSFQKPSPWRLAISSEPAPMGMRTLDAGTNTPRCRQPPQNLSRKAARDACGGSASQPSAPPETTSPQHVSV
mmetsp:Transcript_16688/g.48331  ORF Transcript_16688/g.48331 Transcript_16688/m.48331 type:complete len:362 (-) Transcript_16688:714-1799(-)